ncbi:hypothetical protein [Mycoplasmopsis cynos]
MGRDHTITYGYIYDGQYLIDEVLVMWFLGFKEGDKLFTIIMLVNL